MQCASCLCDGVSKAYKLKTLEVRCLVFDHVKPNQMQLDLRLHGSRRASTVSEIEKTCRPLRMLLAEDNIVHAKVGLLLPLWLS